MELQINKFSVPENISFNYEELKTALAESVKKYETLVYTDDEIKKAKADKSSLNKLKKALNDERIRREREYMAPFNEFKAQINEIIGIIDKPISMIDTRLKEYEQEQKQEKEAEIVTLWNGMDHPQWLRLDMIFNQKWLNVTFSMKDVQKEIAEKLEQIERDMSTLNLLAFSFEAQEEYKRSLDINRAIAEGERIAEIEKRKEAEKQVAVTEVQAKVVEELKTPEHVQEAGTWINFSACLTVSQAAELKDFFKRRGIKFKAI